MITGDHPVTAESIAKDVGLANSGNLEIITGNELATLSRADLASRLKKIRASSLLALLLYKN